MIDHTLYLDLLGKPFVEGGRGPFFYDCVGLMLELHRRMGHRMPEWASDPEEVPRAMSLFETVTEPRPGDCVLLRSPDPGWHVGVLVTPTLMLHARSEAGVLVESIARAPWKNHVEAYFRWRN